MRAKRWIWSAAMSTALLTAPAYQPVELPLIGAENAYAEKPRCEIEVCFEVDLRLISARVCFTKDFDCK